MVTARWSRQPVATWTGREIPGHHPGAWKKNAGAWQRRRMTRSSCPEPQFT